MAVLVRDYTIERGIPFRRVVTVTTLDLANADVIAGIREAKVPMDSYRKAFGSGKLITNFDIEETAPLTTGAFNLTLPITKSLLLERGLYDYDVVLVYTNGDRRRILMGTLTAIEVASIAHAND